MTRLKACFKVFIGANLFVISTSETFFPGQMQAVCLDLPSLAESLPPPEMDSRFFKLFRVYSNSLEMPKVGEFPWS